MGSMEEKLVELHTVFETRAALHETETLRITAEIAKLKADEEARFRSLTAQREARETAIVAAATAADSATSSEASSCNSHACTHKSMATPEE